MVTYELKPGTKLTPDERKMLSDAKKLPVIYDDDSPEMTADMERAFIEARRKKPYRGEPLTLYVSSETLEKAKGLGEDYIALQGRLLDRALEDYHPA